LLRSAEKHYSTFIETDWQYQTLLLYSTPNFFSLSKERLLEKLSSFIRVLLVALVANNILRSKITYRLL
jgi:hypothetical protein